MSSLLALQDAFRRATVEFRWRDFEVLLGLLGYEQKKNSKTGGSKRTYVRTSNKHVIKVHAPHDGKMTRGFIKRLRATLEAEGLL